MTYYEKENQALREQVLGLRQLLDHKEAQAGHTWQLFSAASQEGDLLTARLAALLPAYPQIAAALYQAEAAVPVQPPVAASPYAPSPQLVAPPPPTPLTGMQATPAALFSSTPVATALENVMQPMTPSRMVLSLDSMTPVPTAGIYGGVPPTNLFGAPQASGALAAAALAAPSPAPDAALTPATPALGLAPGEGQQVPTPRRLPTSAPPEQAAPDFGNSPARPAPPTTDAFGSPLSGKPSVPSELPGSTKLPKAVGGPPGLQDIATAPTNGSS